MFRNKLQKAITSGNVEGVEREMGRGVAQNIKDAALLYATSHKAKPEILDALIAHGAKVDARNGDRETPLILAAKSGNLLAVETLIRHGADVDTHDDNFYALFYAASNGHRDVVACLLDKGADVNNADHRGASAIIVAAESNHMDIVAQLEQHGASVADNLKVATINGWRSGAQRLAQFQATRKQLNTAKQEDGFVKQDEATIVDRATLAEAGIRLTKVFNFKAREVVTIAEKDGQISAFIQNFADIENQDQIVRAFDALREQGGNPPDWRGGPDKPKHSVKIG